ncbi:MAG TPA: helix-turn-helix domain-containing protein [Solirubrobacter sp.]|jgi:AcrR family transcriptional regulator|nr:helix-turn-helix domain-containing protein [Solirubrobacter sp.]
MSTTAVRPLRADARRNRARVLAAARAVFAERGREAQMDDVARQAEVGVGTVYRHFPTKETLIEALAVDSFERVAAKAKEALETIEDPWEALTSTLWAAAEILASDRSLSELLALIPGPTLHGLPVEQELNQTMTELIRRAQDAGALRADVVLDDIPMLMCGIGSATRKEHRCQEAWKRHMRIVIDGLRASAASEALPS